MKYLTDIKRASIYPEFCNFQLPYYTTPPYSEPPASLSGFFFFGMWIFKNSNLTSLPESPLLKPVRSHHSSAQNSPMAFLTVRVDVLTMMMPWLALTSVT